MAKKQVKVVEVQPNPADIKELEGFAWAWDRVKAWFKRSETIFIARATYLTGFVTAAFAAIDWSPLFTFFGTNTGFDKKQVMALGLTAAIQGIALEIGRRRNDKVLAAVK
jgi:hypothetical protein